LKNNLHKLWIWLNKEWFSRLKQLFAHTKCKLSEVKCEVAHNHQFVTHNVRIMSLLFSLKSIVQANFLHILNLEFKMDLKTISINIRGQLQRKTKNKELYRKMVMIHQIEAVVLYFSWHRIKWGICIKRRKNGKTISLITVVVTFRVKAFIRRTRVSIIKGHFLLSTKVISSTRSKCSINLTIRIGSHLTRTLCRMVPKIIKITMICPHPNNRTSRLRISNLLNIHNQA